ncbi:hypothetical protein HJA76_09730 [Rhizobium bangladeshense]|uniref:hypothetical protein n=1 Tax=Rhizobium bangladeshense TaxID=1138189 RepID=UPI001C82924C|nr:hypothetical protein [Rhizobium bangladeshense]MBX4919988.1 hypothetical protein [Rhizobium bangladeshense]
MIDVANLRPSDIERLREDGISQGVKNAILEGLNRLLREVRPDGGADSDRIHMVASMLAMGDVWRRVDAKELAAAIAYANELNIKSFIEGLPERYGRDVAYHLVTTTPKTSVSSRRFAGGGDPIPGYGVAPSSAEYRFVRMTESGVAMVAIEPALDIETSGAWEINFGDRMGHRVVERPVPQPLKPSQKRRKSEKSVP